MQTFVNHLKKKKLSPAQKTKVYRELLDSGKVKNKAALARKFGVSRAEGILFLGYYIAYTLYLVLAATHHDALPVFSSVMIWFVIPLTVIVLCITVYQQSFIRK